MTGTPTRTGQPTPQGHTPGHTPGTSLTRRRSSFVRREIKDISVTPSVKPQKRKQESKQESNDHDSFQAPPKTTKTDTTQEIETSNIYDNLRDFDDGEQSFIADLEYDYDEQELEQESLPDFSIYDEEDPCVSTPPPTQNKRYVKLSSTLAKKTIEIYVHTNDVMNTNMYEAFLELNNSTVMLDGITIDTTVVKKGKPDEVVNMSIRNGISATAKRCTIKRKDIHTMSISSSSTSYVGERLTAQWMVAEVILSKILELKLSPKASDTCGRCRQSTRDDIHPQKCTFCGCNCHQDPHCYNSNAKCCKECSLTEAKIYNSDSHVIKNIAALTDSRVPTTEWQKENQEDKLREVNSLPKIQRHPIQCVLEEDYTLEDTQCKTNTNCAWRMLKKDIKHKYKPSMDAALGQPDTREKEKKHIYKKHYSLNTKEGAQTVLLTITLYDNVKDPKVWVQSSPVSILHCAHFLDYQFEKMSNSAINDNVTLSTNNLSPEIQKVQDTCNKTEKSKDKTPGTMPNTKDHVPQLNCATISKSIDASKSTTQVTDNADLTGHDTNIIECSQRVDIGRMLEKYSYHHALKLDTRN